MQKTYVVVDVEVDGPIPGDYSMISIGVVVLDKNLDKQFTSNLNPISESYENQRLNFLGLSRKETLEYSEPKQVMRDFCDWIKENSEGKPVFVSDNKGFDWMFVCWYFWHFLRENPFGHTSVDMKSLYQGVEKDMSANIHKLKKTKHDHNPLNDAIGNAEALLEMNDKGLNLLD